MSLMSSSREVVLDDELRRPGTIPERAMLLRRRINVNRETAEGCGPEEGREESGEAWGSFRE